MPKTSTLVQRCKQPLMLMTMKNIMVLTMIQTLAQVQAASPPGSGQGGEKGAAAVGGKIGKLEQNNDDDDGDDDILSNKPSKGSLTSKLAEISYLPKLAEYQGSTNAKE